MGFGEGAGYVIFVPGGGEFFESDVEYLGENARLTIECFVCRVKLGRTRSFAALRMTKWGVGMSRGAWIDNRWKRDNMNVGILGC